jgi:hypothetical protein
MEHIVATVGTKAIVGTRCKNGKRSLLERIVATVGTEAIVGSQ